MSYELPKLKLEYKQAIICARAIIRELYMLVIDYGNSVDLLTEEGYEEQRICLKAIKEYIVKIHGDTEVAFMIIEEMHCQSEHIECQHLMKRI